MRRTFCCWILALVGMLFVTMSGRNSKAQSSWSNQLGVGEREAWGSPLDPLAPIEVPISGLIVMDRLGGVAQDIALLDTNGRFRLRLTCRTRSIECRERSVLYFDESGRTLGEIADTSEWLIGHLLEGARRASPTCRFAVRVETGLRLRLAAAVFRGCDR